MSSGPATNWDKFRLLMWKNWLLQWRHKIQMVVEILVPVVFSALLVLIRSMVHPDVIATETHYKPCSIDNLDPLRNFNASYPINVNYRLAYTPDHPALAQLLDGVANSLQLKPAAAYKTANELQIALAQNPFLAGVEFADSSVYYTANPQDNSLPRDLKYALRFPSELRTGRVNPVLFNWRTDLTFPRFQYPGPRNKEGDDGGIPTGYRQEGFLALQHALAHEFLRIQSNESQQMPEIVLQRFPYPPYVDDILLTGLENIVSLIIMLSFVYPCTNTVKFIAAEKERQLKEAMKIMGLPNWLHWSGWFARSMIFMTISISLMVILLKVPWYPGNSVAIFTHSNWLTLWLFLFVYSIVTATFCFMLSVFFSRANTAAAVSGLAWFMFYAVFTFTYQTYNDMQLYQKLLLCLLSNTGMAFGFQIIIRFEGTNEGLQWSNIFEPVSVDDNLTVGYIMIMLLLTASLYFLITLYVEKIYPGEYGVPQPWWFPFSRSFWCGRNRDVSSTNDDNTRSFHNTENFETEPKHKTQGIQIRALRKEFNKKKVAVQSTTLNMYEDQITVLLGHNGAGKSTTMAMLTGMLPPSSGTAIINGNDIRRDIAAVRSSLGLCPQHNILFDELTVAEHIEFFSRLKGYKKDDVEAEIQRFLRVINLEDKRDAMSSTLSGGMKRKLSVCVAFCGGSKVVLCDEPTSGMDPAARRALWDVLKSEKVGRTVLLSTHFMDEADILGDRIAIMSSGALKACGSSYFLKKKFGVGYHLVCAKSSTCRAEDVTALLQRYVPEARIENDIGTELSYQLSELHSHVFPKMLDELERSLVQLGLSSYGISMSTLEEVFMSVGTESESEDHGGRAIAMQANLKTDLTLNPSDDLYLQSGFSLARSQLIALFNKKFLQTRRSWIMLCIQIAIPALFIIITVLSERSRARFQDLPRLDINFDKYKKTVTTLEAVPENGLIASQYKMLFASDNPNRKLSVIDVATEDYILELYKQSLVMVNRRYAVGATMMEDGSRITAWFNNQPYHSAPLSVNMVHNAVIRAKLGELFSISVTNAPMPYTADTRMEMVQLGGTMGFQLAVNVSFAMAFVGAFYVLAYIRERTSRAKLLQMVSGARVYAYWLTAFIWDYLTYLVTILVLIAIFAAFQERGWSTSTELGRILVVLVLFGWALLPTTYIFSMLFTVPASGYTRMTMFYVFTGMAFFFIVFIMSMPIYDLADVANALKWGFLIFPHFALSNSLNNINLNVQGEELCRLRCEAFPGCTKELMCMLIPTCCNVNYFQWKEPGVGRDFVYLFVVGLVAMFVLMMIEYRLVATLKYAIRSLWAVGLRVMDTGPIDSDVLEERHRIQTMSKMEIDTHRLVLKNVSKAYGSFVAVNQLSIGVDGSECFGLLGINGAGKTSTFKMLTGDTKITAGEAWVSGVSLRNNMNGVHKIIGYCPQFDALIDEMSGHETLSMFSRLRGVPTRRIQQTIDGLAAQLNFVQHLHKPVRAYSGGNKRKLSTAVALIGNPVVVYLDEPTTGMDPGAKRCLWNLVTSVRQMGKSIVLTSHSMDECEALCTRLAIMVNGEFKCLGSVQHLKGKFSNGFTLIIKIKTALSDDLLAIDDDEEDGLDISSKGVSANVGHLKDFVLEQFQGAHLQEDYHGLLTYYIPRTKDTEWSTMFGAMEVAKRRFDIEDYSLNQISLEQVFLSFAKHQREE